MSDRPITRGNNTAGVFFFYAGWCRGVSAGHFEALSGRREVRVAGEVGGIFADRLEAIDVDEAGTECDGDRRQNGGKGFDDPKHHTFAAGLGDFGEVSLLIVRDFEALSRFDPQDAGEVASFVATQFRGP